MSQVSVDFIGLTGHTTFDIFGHKVFYIGPPIVFFSEVKCF